MKKQYKKKAKPIPGSIPFDPKYPPTEQQRALIDATKALPEMSGNPFTKDAVIGIAVAGSGKTTVYKYVAHELPTSTKVLLTVFSRHLADATIPQLPSFCDCNTKHSVGRRILSGFLPKIELQAGGGYGKYKKPDKVENILRQHRIFDPDLANPDDTATVWQNLINAKKMVSLIKSSFTDWNDLEAVDSLAINYGIIMDCQDDFYGLIGNIMDRDLELSAQGLINFDDMYYLCVKWSDKLTFPRYDLILADECQDFNRTDHMFLRLLQGDGAIAFVGDPNQSIIGFAGAMPDSVDKIKEAWKPREFGLTYNFRCGRAIIETVKSIVPEIQAWDGAQEGEVISQELKEFKWDLLKPGALALARRNASLVRWCFAMIRSGRHANIKGNDISRGLKTLHTKITKEVKKKQGGLDCSINAFRGIASDCMEKEIEAQYARKRVSQSAIEFIEDRYETLQAISEGCTEHERIPDAIKELFEEKGEAVTFSSIHKSKGLEASQVAIIDSDSIRLDFKGMKNWEHEQEKNLEYVAKTRAKDQLFLLRK